MYEQAIAKFIEDGREIEMFLILEDGIVKALDFIWHEDPEFADLVEICQNSICDRIPFEDQDHAERTLHMVYRTFKGLPSGQDYEKLLENMMECV